MSILHTSKDLAAQLAWGRTYQSQDPCFKPTKIVFHGDLNSKDKVVIEDEGYADLLAVGNRIQALLRQGCQYCGATEEDESREVCAPLMIGAFLQCCGLGDVLDSFDLCCPDEDEPERCSNPATCTYDDGIERIPLCREHYDAWCRKATEPGDGTNPVWWSQEWLEKYGDEMERFRRATVWRRAIEKS
jgi:hypothetical protein